MVTLRLEGVGARHGRRQVLADITTPPAAAGDVVAVIGPNAAGKSTLFKRMAGLLPGPGTVRLEGTSRGPAAICYMPQDTAGTAVLSVYEVVLLARKQGSAWAVAEGDLHAVDTSLAALGILPLADRPLGHLSGGQRQLVGIAQALVREPAVLLLDEPTSALDLGRRIEVLELIRTLARDRGILVFAALHDLNDVLRYADTTMVIAGGTLAACGPTGDVLSTDLLRRVYGVDARIEVCSRGWRHVMVDGVIQRAAGLD
ncbi:ABC transporter ATP-binding protein [Azospirillum sp. ST 5-10]|uniref:ABC transporter ATP-binding protein n=1 Tax=unclassified Azospirillum TaxID=2630922 RepID=UPI003F4A2441